MNFSVNTNLKHNNHNQKINKNDNNNNKIANKYFSIEEQIKNIDFTTFDDKFINRDYNLKGDDQVNKEIIVNESICYKIQICKNNCNNIINNFKYIISILDTNITNNIKPLIINIINNILEIIIYSNIIDIQRWHVKYLYVYKMVELLDDINRNYTKLSLDNYINDEYINKINENIFFLLQTTKEKLIELKEEISYLTNDDTTIEVLDESPITYINNAKNYILNTFDIFQSIKLINNISHNCDINITHNLINSATECVNCALKYNNEPTNNGINKRIDRIYVATIKGETEHAVEYSILAIKNILPIIVESFLNSLNIKDKSVSLNLPENINDDTLFNKVLNFGITSN